jgi:WXG100 family type VII secretion target
MTMPNVRTTEEGMQRAVQLFQSTTEEFNGYLQGVNGAWATMRAAWGGTSSNNFGGGIDAWENQFVVVINNLIDMMQKMGVKVNEYGNAEMEAADTAQSSTNGLPDFNTLVSTPMPGA